MSYKKWSPLLEVLFFTIVFFLMHQLFIKLFGTTVLFEQFHYCLAELYLFFGVCSFTIILILILVNRKNIDYVGYSFMLLTILKMIVSYIYLLSILNPENQNIRYEKLNFFVVFVLFLAIETFVTARILNNKQ